MKYKFILIILLFIFSGIGISAQTIEADIISGCDSLRVTFSLNPAVPDGTPLRWDFGNGATVDNNPSPVVLYDEPGKFSVSCLINNITRIYASDQITIYKSPSSAFLYSDSLEFSPLLYVFWQISEPADTGILSYYWQFSDGDTWAIPRVEHYFSDFGNDTVSLTVTSSVGCSSTTSQYLLVAEPHLVPNVFTPDGDNENDFFQVRTDGINIYTFSVYSRSGVLLYRSESPSISWDGRSFSGQELTAGIYYYTIESPVTLLKGFVYLFR